MEGKFLYASMFNGNFFKGSVSFPEIELNEPGIYSIEYYYHFYCPLPSCKNSKVSMTIYFDYDNNQTLIKHDFTNINNLNAIWTKQTFNITTTVKNILKVWF